MDLKKKTPASIQHQPFWLMHTMTLLYCRQIHRSSKLCPRCAKILEMESKKLAECEYHQKQLRCIECNRQCYSNAMRLEINHIIRWAEPRLRWRRYFFAIQYYFTQLKK